ncbi:MAG TPA: hypothetical protein VGD84_05360 [Pseudonocardiaceae bacterium]
MRESEQPRADHDRARFLRDLSAQCFFDGLVTFGSSGRETPVDAVVADEDQFAGRCHAHAGGAVRNAGRLVVCGPPRHQPVLAV